MTQKIKVATLDQIPADRGLEVKIEGRTVGLFRSENQIFAIDALCPHAGGPLGEAHCNGTVVTCPWHGWQFNLKTGQHTRNSTTKVATYKVIIEQDDVFLEIPASELILKQ